MGLEMFIKVIFLSTLKGYSLSLSLERGKRAIGTSLRSHRRKIFVGF
jgi:hypothetical protein